MNGIKGTIGGVFAIFGLLSLMVLILWWQMGGSALLVLLLAFSHATIGTGGLFVGSVWTAKMMQMGANMSAPEHSQNTAMANMVRTAMTNKARLERQVNEASQAPPPDLPQLPRFEDGDNDEPFVIKGL